MWSVSHPSVRTRHIYMYINTHICDVFFLDGKDFAANKINKKMSIMLTRNDSENTTGDLNRPTNSQARNHSITNEPGKASNLHLSTPGQL